MLVWKPSIFFLFNYIVAQRLNQMNYKTLLMLNALVTYILVYMTTKQLQVFIYSYFILFMCTYTDISIA